nr:hypothetical protein [Tanacetum cinerariifolium]
QAEQELLQTTRDFHLCAKGQNQGKWKIFPKPKIPPPPKRENPAKDSIGHECGEIGHWKENCPQYLARLMKKKKNTALGAGGLGSKGYNKRAKLDLDSALLWHCRLGHISKKRIKKLQHEGLLNSSSLRAFEKYVSYVCGLFKIMSRQGASYFVTFTDDFCRYGYVCLLKDKHEVFETFKVFQKEVENQLGKTIKSLRSDRGGKYTSQELLDHLKDHGIIAHRTPPYTPQHNDPESEKWLNAMNVEIQSMKDNEVWVLVELPPNGKTVG